MLKLITPLFDPAFFVLQSNEVQFQSKQNKMCVFVLNLMIAVGFIILDNNSRGIVNRN